MTQSPRQNCHTQVANSEPLLAVEPPTNGNGRIVSEAGDGTPEGGKRRRRRPSNALAMVNFVSSQSDWSGVIRANEFTGVVELSGELQLWGKGRTKEGWRELTDEDVLEAMLWLQGHGFPRASKAVVLDMFVVIAGRNRFHPVREYLTHLKWDGTARVHRLLLDYCKAELPSEYDDPGARDRVVAYLEHVGRCFMTSAVARILEPGCKVDHMLLLLGPQGIGKSRFVAALCPDRRWFSDDISPDLVQRDTKESLRGKWLIELAELPHLKRESERVKAFVSRQDDRYRKAYGLLNRDWPRQCVFIGTTNDLEFPDPTGNRRFWPTTINETIDVARISAERDQLWAEAVTLYRSGAEWWLSSNIERIATEQQAEFIREDVWFWPFANWIEANRMNPDRNVRPFLLTTLMTECLLFPDARAIPKQDQYRAAECLKSLGFRRGKQARSPEGRGRPWKLISPPWTLP
jgi:predicted P-loop ATPase